MSSKVNKREFYKLFDGKNMPLLRWTANITLGLVSSGN